MGLPETWITLDNLYTYLSGLYIFKKLQLFRRMLWSLGVSTVDND